MTTQERKMFRYHIVRMDAQNRFDFNKNFFELNWYNIETLAQYAEIFHIKGSSKGWSPARTLWNQLKEAHEKFINL